jgi:hypothetical protein
MKNKGKLISIDLLVNGKKISLNKKDKKEKDLNTFTYTFKNNNNKD